MHIPSIEPLQERRPAKGTLRDDVLIETKVRNVVLERIRYAAGGLLPTALSPQMIWGLLPISEGVQKEQARRKKKRLRKIPLSRSIPVGLVPLDNEGCLNALMQWLLFIPEFAEQFFFAPKSFAVFQEFVDQYQADQQQGVAVSSANNRAILEFLQGKLSDLSLLSLFQFLLNALGKRGEIAQNLEEGCKKGSPSDLFLLESLGSRQFVTDHFYYDLDAFIEQRPDGAQVNYVAYVKHQGSWYQCDEEKVTLIRSNCLQGPLKRSSLLHYKQIRL